MPSKMFRSALTVVAASLFIVVGTLVLASLLDHMDLVPAGSPLYGIDFIPPAWFLVPVILTILVTLGSRRIFAAASLGILFLVLAAGYGDVSLPLLHGERGSDPAALSLSVAALNVRYYSYGLDKVIDEVKAVNADLTLLSENVLSDVQAAHVRESLAPATFRMDHENGTAIVSRYPIVSYAEVTLPSYEASLSGGNDIDSMETHPHRSFSHAVLDVRGTRVHAISIRFIAGRPKDHSLAENLRWGKYLLRVQAEEVKFFTEYVSRLDGPVIFGGDLNAPPGSKTMRAIDRVARDAQLDHNFWGGLTFRTEFPTLRIDYLFSMNGVKSVAARRLDAKVSDHYPVYAEFRFSRSPAALSPSEVTDTLRIASVRPVP
jgi:endonuclease/exonuclease/phosphatase (EEP) superfamily protein YafD